jgi:hypothetical protein
VPPLARVRRRGMMAVMSFDATREAGLRQVERTLESLGAEPVRGEHAVEARVEGLAVSCWFRPNGNRSIITCCLVLIPQERQRLDMDIRPRTAVALNQLEHGGAIDLGTGDEAFDGAFMVEAAPSDAARLLLDEETRTTLLRFRPCRMTIAEGELRFEKNAFVDEPGQIAKLVELCVQTVLRLMDLPADLRARRFGEAALRAGYRGPDPESLRASDPSENEAAEHAKLREARAQRHRGDALFLVTLFGIGTLVWLAIALVMRTGCE